jgi:cupin 2 domain-containing protein
MNLLDDLPVDLTDEVVQTLVEARHVRIERIVSHGQASPEGIWYDQPRHEWVAVLAGAALLRFEDDPEPLDMKPGDFVNIRAHRRHRVESTVAAEPTIWLAIHYG